jgi:hypothetical protein
MRSTALAALVLVAASLAPSAARACASCGCGDPTLTAMGVEKPFSNRFRLGLEERFGGHVSGDPSYQEATWTLRSSLLVSYSPTARITLGALLPLVTQWEQDGGNPWERSIGLGDLELSLRGVVFRERKFSPRHLLSLLGGLKLPTGPRAYDQSGFPLPDDTQPGSGSWDPFAGVTYGWFGDRFAAFASGSYRYTTVGRRDYRRGMSVGATAGLQFQPWQYAAFSLSVDFRWAAPDSLSNGVDAPNTGGTMLGITPSIMVSPVPDWLIKLSFQIHAADWLNGVQSESSTVILSTVVDIG